MDKRELAEKILGYIGGSENVENVMHCSTRLRFAVKKKDKVQKDELAKLEGVLGVTEGAGQIQVVIGAAVDDVFDELSKHLNIALKKEDEKQEKKKFSQRFIDFFTNAFVPLLPALVASGLIKGLVAVASATGILPSDSSTYTILAAIGNATFYFIPIFVAYNIAKYYKVNVVVPMAIMAVLLEPSFVSLMGGENPVNLFGITVAKATYASQMLVAITAIPFYIVLEKFLNKHVYKDIRMFVVPLVGMVATTCLVVYVLGPVTVTVSNWIALLVNWLNDRTATVLGAVVGGFSTYMTMAGLHLAIGPIIMINFTTTGYDPILAYMSMACYAQMGAGFAIWLRSKTRAEKSMALVSSVTGLFTGVTEPIIFGLGMKHPKSFIAIGIGAAVGGGILGFFKVYSYGIANAGLLGLAVYYSDTFVYYLIGAAASLIVSFIFTWILAFGKKNELKAASHK